MDAFLTPPGSARDGALLRSDGSFDAGSRAALLSALNNSLGYLRSARAARDYARLAKRGSVSGVTLTRVRRSAERLRQLLKIAPTGEAFQTAVAREFAFVTPGTGNDALFTGYFEAVYDARRTPNAEYRYPVFGVPSGFGSWPHPHPTRRELEGDDGLQWPRGPLRGASIAFLRGRLEAFLVQVEGSARLRLTDGSRLALAYAAHTDRAYTSVGQELVRAGRIPKDELTLQTLIAHFREHPDELSLYLPRNDRFVFVRPTRGAPPQGSLGVPLIAERSVATDAAVLPPGAPALIQVRVVNPVSVRALGTETLTRYVLAQDAGAAITGPARVDIYMGSGPAAERRAGALNCPGRLSYLLLRDG